MEKKRRYLYGTIHVHAAAKYHKILSDTIKQEVARNFIKKHA